MSRGGTAPRPFDFAQGFGAPQAYKAVPIGWGRAHGPFDPSTPLRTG
jgi:hypothetical protein